MNYKRVFALLSLGIVILAIMIYFVGPGEILKALETADPFYVLVAIIIQIVVLILLTACWGVVASSLDIKYKKIPLFAMELLGLAINNLTPSGRAGGEPVRAYLLSKYSGTPFKKTFATVMGDKLFDTFPFAALAIIAMIYLIFTIRLSFTVTATLIGVLILFVLLLGFIIYICINESFAVRSIKWVFRQVRKITKRDLDNYEKTTLEQVSGFQDSLRYLMANKRVFFLAVLISCGAWLLEVVRVYVVFLAFGTDVSLGLIASVFLISTLVGMIPTLPGGVGAIDGIMILVYSIAGISSFISTAATLIERLISYWLVSFMGLATLPYFGTGVLDEVSISESEQTEEELYEEQLDDEETKKLEDNKSN